MPFANYDFALTEAQESHARRLHEESLVMELMFQGPLSHASLPDAAFEDIRKHYRETGDGMDFIACFARSWQLAAAGEVPLEEIWRGTGLTCNNVQISRYDDQSLQLFARIFDAFDWLLPVRSAADIRRAYDEGLIGIFLNYQNYPPDIDSMAFVEASREHGVMMAGLTYNHRNPIGAGCTSDDQGLTSFGKAVVRRMNEIGMIVDVSHAGPRTTLDACRHAGGIVIASHAGAAALFDHPRLKSDQELRAIADTGGLIGVLAAPALMCDPPSESTVELTLDHIDYIANLIGVEHVALGTDWPMQVPTWVLTPDGPFQVWAREMGFDPEDVRDTHINMKGFDDYRDLPNITRGLVARGWSDNDIRAVIGNNALRVFEAVCG